MFEAVDDYTFTNCLIVDYVTVLHMCGKKIKKYGPSTKEKGNALSTDLFCLYYMSRLNHKVSSDATYREKKAAEMKLRVQ